MGCGVGHRRDSDPGLLWLWRRLAATALNRPLSWEPPYAGGAALEKTKKKKRKDLFTSESSSIQIKMLTHVHG